MENTEIKEELKYTPTSTNVLVAWKKSDSKLILTPELRQMMELDDNRTPEVVAVGMDCKQVKKGDFVMFNSGGKFVDFNGMTFAMFKEHQLDMIFSHKPDLTPMSINTNLNGINTSKTEANIIQLNKKHGIN